MAARFERRSAVVRGAAVLMAAALATAALAGAAAGGAKPLTKKRALKLFYKKAQADQLFVEDGGEVLITAGPNDWFDAEPGGATMEYGANYATFLSGGTGTFFAELSH